MIGLKHLEIDILGFEGLLNYHILRAFGSIPQNLESDLMLGIKVQFHIVIVLLDEILLGEDKNQLLI